MEIFKNDNNWNEKAIVGFIAFAIMSLIMVADLVTIIRHILANHIYLTMSFSFPFLPLLHNAINISSFPFFFLQP